ncbi:MAG TPA: SCO family protein [Pseudogracilibacillus sp.]|nr:SCO family protein [Pseudogracilibacillus sp.]
MKKIIQGSLLAIVLIVLAACGSNDDAQTNNEGETSKQPMATMAPDMNLGDFEAVNQDEEAITKADLDGEWSVINFVFTNCTTICLPMTRNMAYLQGELDEADLNDVNLVSFTVDPERDTPEVLQEYGDSYGANYDNWDFLTGYDFETIKEFSEEHFKSPLMEAPEDDDQITHTVSFFVINPDGEIINRYKGNEQDEIDKLVDYLAENK